MSRRKNINKLVLIIQLISIIIIIISVYYIYMWYIDNNKTNELLQKIYSNADITYENIDNGNIEKNSLKINFNDLIKLNSDTIGWIQVEGTNINYPVVQAKDNDFYLTHSFDKTYNKAGWIFADYTNLNNDELDKNTVIYGHNRQNRSMFGTLPNTLQKEWRDNKRNRYINFSTLNKNMIWEVFSTYTIDSEEYYIKTKFSSDVEYEQFIKNIKNRSNYNFNVDITNDDKILTLSTCTNIGEGRTVLHAKLIK